MVIPYPIPPLYYRKQKVDIANYLCNYVQVPMYNQRPFYCITKQERIKDLFLGGRGEGAQKLQVLDFWGNL